MKKIFIVVIAALTLASCKKDTDNTIDLNSTDYLAFGTSYGMCIGDCAKLFAISNGQLFPDNITTHYTGTLSFSSTPLPDAQYQKAKDLLTGFPAYLLNSADTTFGCPDCTDQGAIHLQLNQNGITKTWHIDTNTANQPAEIKNYIIRVRDVLAQL